MVAIVEILLFGASKCGVVIAKCYFSWFPEGLGELQNLYANPIISLVASRAGIGTPSIFDEK